MDPRCRDALFIVVTAGFLYGCQFSYPTFATQFTRTLSECPSFSERNPCNRMSAICFWNDTATTPPVGRAVNNRTTPTGSCQYLDQPTPCDSVNTSAQCALRPHCKFVGAPKGCIHDRPWTAMEERSFFALGFSGTMISGLCTGFALSFVPHLKYLGLTATLSALGAVVLAISWQFPLSQYHLNNFAGLLIGRILGGVSNGMLNAAALYGGAKAREIHRDLVIIAFDVSNPVAAFLGALFMFLLDQFSAGPPQYELFHVLHAAIFISALTLLAATRVVAPVDASLLSSKPTTDTPLLAVAHRSSDDLKATTSAAVHDNDDDYTPRPVQPLWLAYVAGFFLAVSIPFCGYQVVMSYAPALAVEMGLAPFTGALLVMAFNMVASALALVVRSAGVRPPTMLLIGHVSSICFSLLVAASTSPLFFTTPGDSWVASAMSMIGLMGVLGTFRLWLNPAFVVLSQRIFEPEQRAIGASVVLTFNSLCSVALLFVFPRTGHSTTFAVFACVTCGCAMVCYRMLRNVR